MALSYTIQEGLAGFRRARFAAAMAVSALAVALVLIGLVGLLAWQGQRVAESLRQRVAEVQVFLEPADEAQVQRLGERLRAFPGVDSVDYVSREEAAETFRAEFGDEADLFMDEPFLPASFRVRVAGPYASPDSLTRLADSLGAWPRVDEVMYDAPLLARVEQNLRLFTAVGFAVGAFVILAALLLVGNTVRLTIYARRMLIRTMKLVGATDGFVRRPFLVEGVAQGLMAGLVASPLLWALYAFLLRTGAGFGLRDWPGGSAWPTLLGVVVLGVVLGWLASAVAVRTFIRNVSLS